jgi:hypothetical protein
MKEAAVVARPLNLDNGSVYHNYKSELLAFPTLPPVLSFYQVTDFHESTSKWLDLRQYLASPALFSVSRKAILMALPSSNISVTSPNISG